MAPASPRDISTLRLRLARGTRRVVNVKVGLSLGLALERSIVTAPGRGSLDHHDHSVTDDNHAIDGLGQNHHRKHSKP